MPYLSNIEICRIARRLAKKYRTANPEKLCRVLDIQIIYQDMGTEVTSIKALMVVDRRIKCIVVNANLPDVILNFILAHELGHAVLGLWIVQRHFCYGKRGKYFCGRTAAWRQ